MSRKVVRRELTSWEREVVAKLLSLPFAGRDNLRVQLDGAWVVGEARSEITRLEFGVPETSPMASVERRVPVSAHAIDSDGVAVLYLLHIVDGRLRELEFLRGDRGGLPPELDPADLSVRVERGPVPTAAPYRFT